MEVLGKPDAQEISRGRSKFLSYLLLNGTCSNCNKKISLRYPIIELVSALSVCIVAHYFGVSIQAFFAICLTWALIVLSAIDLDTRYLPDDKNESILFHNFCSRKNSQDSLKM